MCVGHGECPFIVSAQQGLKVQKWSPEFHLNVHLLTALHGQKRLSSGVSLDGEKGESEI